MCPGLGHESTSRESVKETVSEPGSLVCIIWQRHTPPVPPPLQTMLSVFELEAGLQPSLHRLVDIAPAGMLAGR